MRRETTADAVVNFEQRRASTMLVLLCLPDLACLCTRLQLKANTSHPHPWQPAEGAARPLEWCQSRSLSTRVEIVFAITLAASFYLFLKGLLLCFVGEVVSFCRCNDLWGEL